MIAMFHSTNFHKERIFADACVGTSVSGISNFHLTHERNFPVQQIDALWGNEQLSIQRLANFSNVICGFCRSFSVKIII
jgi:hypothetical protein